jgi:hypothetical protein
VAVRDARWGDRYELGCEVGSAVGLDVVAGVAAAGIAAGSYSSADARAEKVELSPTVTGKPPPAIRTWPSDKSVAV